MPPPPGRPTVAPTQPVPALDPWAAPPPTSAGTATLSPADARQGVQDAARALAGNAAGVLGSLGFAATSQAIQKGLHPVELPPAGASQARQYDHYKRMLEARGFTLDPANPTVVALRGLDHTGAQHATTSAASYDDTMVVLTKDAAGREHVTTFAGSTHPGQRTFSSNEPGGVPDVNGDHVADVGMINAGEYRVVPHADHAGSTAWGIQTVAGSGVLPGVRDTNHDGVYSAEERQASETRTPAPDTLTGVLIHQGGSGNPWSVGCLNLSQDASVYPRFVQAVGGHDSSMKLVILDKNAD